MVQFNFTYDPGTSLEQRVGFELAARIWGAYLTDDISVNLHIVSTDTLEGNAIGGAVPLFHEQNYGVLNEYLEQDATQSDGSNAPSTDEQVIDGLQDGNTVDVLIEGDVVDGNSNVLLTSAQAKALGMDEAITLDNGTTWNRDLVDATALDGYIVINQSYDWNYDFLRTDTPQGQTLDFLSLAMHEIGHQLGFVSGLDGLLDVNQRYSGDTEVDGFTLLDLFRHTADSQAVSNPDGAVVDLTTGSDAIFSVNGGADGLALFSTGQGGDGFQAAHWKRMKKALGVMDPTLAYRERLNITDLDAQAMDALGYDVNYDAFDTALDISALLLEAEMAVATQMGLDGSILAETRSNGYPDGEYELNFGQWWQIFEAQILELGYGEWWQLLELGYGLWFQELDAGLLALGYGAWFQEFENMVLELGYGAWFQEFEITMLDLGYGNWWQLLELGYGNWWQQLETFFSTLDTVGETNGEAVIDLNGLHGNNSQGIYRGSNEDDIIGGTQVQDRVAGGKGDDLIDGAEGDDILWGDAGQDVLYGQRGNDVISGGGGDDLILGEEGDDQLLGDRGADILSGGAGNDVLSGGKGRDELKGGADMDVLAGGDGDDWLQGGDQDDMLMGNADQDQLEGGDGNDVVYGDRVIAAEQSQLAALLQQFLASRQESETQTREPNEAAYVGTNGFIRVEAESMQGSNYYAGTFGNASGEQLLQQWGGDSATATATFSGPSGEYMVIVRYLDEANGQATAAVKVNGNEIDRWQFTQDDNRFNSRTVATGIELNTGDEIELLGMTNGHENAKIDYIDFVPIDAILPTYTEGAETATSATTDNVGTTVQTDSASLINNGSFEAGLDSWTVGTASASLVSNAGRAGTVMSLDMHDAHVYQWFNVTAGNLYEASAFAKFSGNQWSGLHISFFDMNWHQINTRTFGVTGNNWDLYQQQVVAPEDAFYGSIIFSKNGTAGTLLVDDAAVKDLGQVSSLDADRVNLTAHVDNGLVAHWTFDDATGNERVANQDLHLSNTADVTWIEGAESGAIQFAGGFQSYDVAYLPDTSSLRLGEDNGDFSVAFWLNLEANSIGRYQMALHQWNEQDERLGVWVNHNSNHLVLALSTTENKDFQINSQRELSLNQWTHVTYVKEGDQLSLYLDGQFDSGATLQGETFAIDGLLQLGGELTGALDDMRLYERALSHSDVLSLSRHNADQIEGGNGQDFLYGDEGDDVIYGESSQTFDAIASSSTSTTFTGSDAIVLAHQDSMMLSEGTLSFSFQASDVATEQHLFSKDSDKFDDGGHLSVSVINNRLRVRLQSATKSYYMVGLNLQADRAYDVAVTFGSRGAELWLDGVLVRTNSYTGGLSSGSAGNREPIVLGASQGRSGDLVADNLESYFTGTLQDVRLIDQQLSGESIAQLPTAPPSEANVVFEALVDDASNNDTLVGGQGHDRLYGNLGHDTLYGDEASETGSSLENSFGNDLLVGNVGHDSLFGEGGDDILNGSSAVAAGAFEQDTLTGGSGSDQFILGDANRAYYLADGARDYALIKDFTVEDSIQLLGSASDYTQQQQGSHVHLYYGGSELVAIFENTSTFNLGTVADFV